MRSLSSGEHAGDHHAVAVDEGAEHLVVDGQIAPNDHEFVGAEEAHL